MYLDWLGENYREAFWEITEMQNKNKPQHYLRATPNCPLGGGSYCDIASPCTLYEILTSYDLPTLLCL